MRPSSLSRMVPSVELLVLVEAPSASAECVLPHLERKGWNTTQSGRTAEIVVFDGPRQPCCRIVDLSIVVVADGMDRGNLSLFPGNVRVCAVRAGAAVVGQRSSFLRTFCF